MDGNINRSVTLDEENPEGQKTGRFVSMVTPDVENPAAKKMSREAGERSKSMCSRGLNLIRKIRNSQLGPYLPRWSSIYVTSCVFAVSLDPFFFYVVVVDQNQDNKCFEIDKTLAIVVSIMRSITDVIFAAHFICEICKGVQNPNPKTLKKGASSKMEQTGRNSDKKTKIRELTDQVVMKIAQKMPWLSIFTVIDFFALLPLPQVLIIDMFYTVEGSGYVEYNKVMNVLNVILLCQYFTRIYLLSAIEYEMTNSIWVKGLYNLFLYILASHALGAFWYLFSIQREISCWHEACVNHSIDHRECMNTYYCDSRNTTARNIRFLNKHCPLDTPDGALSPFNFGIFLDSLKNLNTEHIKFEKKFFYSLWWGLRNLSNYGTNLTTSTYVWENVFAIFISVVGLLLFYYFIGNMQTYMQIKTTKSVEEMKTTKSVEDMKQEELKKEELRQKTMLRKLDAQCWMATNEVPHEIREEILRCINDHIDADLHKFLFSFLPVKTRTSLKQWLCMKTLKKIKKLQHMDEKVLTLMCGYLKPVTYIENSIIFRMGDLLDSMLIIIEGTVWTYASTDSQAGQGISLMDTEPLGKGHCYGEELLDCASDCFTKLPVSSKHVKCHTKIEAFVLLAKDLETVVSRYPLLWQKSEKVSHKVENIAASTIAKAYRHHLERRAEA
ncbi:hypothetical protein ACFX1X_002187 [Malus domestica]|uniref:cyclic nucleotide-gated ion channel 1-like n=1 Tax=Malus domestica TaxID=3750 RepID=UPI0004992F84|nr:cyclic nucleotide-gated ion channel 1-like [Malus domestica]